MRFGEEIRKEINQGRYGQEPSSQGESGHQRDNRQQAKHFVAGQARKAVLKKGGMYAKAAAIKCGKLAIAGVAKLGGAVLAVVKLPVIFIAALVFLVFVLFMGFLGGMPGEGIVAGVEITERGDELREYAQELADAYNVEQTWLVAGKQPADPRTSYYPQAGTRQLGRLADRNGHDTALALGWGDLYAPVLFLATLSPDKDLMADDEWVKEQLDGAGNAIKPYFYYKESTVTIRTVDDEGESSTDSYTVYLLVEAYTIRGHYSYEYQWVRDDTDDRGSYIRYEQLSKTTKIADGRQYLQDYLQVLYGFEPDDPDAPIMTRTVYEAGSAFSEKAARMAWLLDQHSQLYTASYVSGALIPPQFRAYLSEAEKLTGIPAWLLAGMIQVESTWDPEAVNTSSQCAGLMQVSPPVWSEYAPAAGFDAEQDLWNPRAQIIVGAMYLRDLIGGEVDWKSGWRSDDALYKALAHYGGYGRDVSQAGSYIGDVLSAADAFRARDALWPAPGNYTITFHYNQRYSNGERHKGVDIGGEVGDRLIAVAGGVIDLSSQGEAYGFHLRICGINYDFLYAHLDRLAVSHGQVVRPGQLVGYLGNTGRSSGPHLHFEVRPAGGRLGSDIDPMPFIIGKKE